MTVPGIRDHSGLGRWRSVRSDIASGRAGWKLRLGLTMAVAGLGASILMVVLGLIDQSGGRVDEEHVAVGGFAVLFAWIGVAGWLWWGYGRFGQAIRVVVVLLAIWTAALGLGVALGIGLRHPEFFIAAIIFFAVAVSLVYLSTLNYRTGGGRPLYEPSGAIRVKCPECDYSMVGLSSCQCPECGTQFTIDGLIEAQDYSAMRESAPSSIMTAKSVDASTGIVAPELGPRPAGQY